LNNYDGYGLTASMGWCASAVGFFALLVFLHQILKADMGKPKMIKVSRTIQNGATSFLRIKYTAVVFFVIVFFACMCGFLYNSVTRHCDYATEPNCNPYIGAPGLNTVGVFTGLCFLSGSLISAVAAYVGLWTSAQASVRATWACNDSVNSGLRVSFKSGGVMALAVISAGLMGIQICWLILSISTLDQRLVWQYLSGFGLGGSIVALFARVAAGIYSKASNVSLEVVNKATGNKDVDSFNNPAVVADAAGKSMSIG
jgi:Na+/H+-translocating membrane pyrophosphatase